MGHGVVHSPVTHGIHHGISRKGPPNQGLFIFGQSNGLGLDTEANNTLYPHVFPWSGVTIQEQEATVLADPPVWKFEGPRALSPRTTITGGSYTAGMGGVDLIFGRELDLLLPNQWYVGKMCIDGSSLISHWNNPAYPTGGPALLTQFITFVQNRMTDWNITDPANNIILMFMQGEADTGQTFATYIAALDSMVATLRATFGQCRIVLNRLSNKNDTIGNIRAAQESFVSTDTKATIYYGDNLPLRDGAHYTDDGYCSLALGGRTALVNDLTNVAPQTPRWAGAGPFTVATSLQGITPTMPRHKANDILVLVVAGIGNTAYAAPAGWTEFTNSPQHDGASGLNSRLQAFWFRAVDGSTAAPTVADVAGDDAKIGFVYVVRGATTSGNPFDTTAGDTSATSTSVTCPGVTTTVPNCLVVAMCADTVDSDTPQFTGGTWANANLTNFVEHVDRNTATGAGAGIGIAAGFKATAGATGTTTATLATTGTQARLTIAFKA